MNWLTLALLTIFFYSLMDFFIKLSSDKIHSGLGGFIINFASTIVLLVFLVFSKVQGEKIMETKPGGSYIQLSLESPSVLPPFFFLKCLQQV